MKTEVFVQLSENAKKRLAESEFWHELYVAFRKQKKDNRSKLSKMQKKRA